MVYKINEEVLKCQPFTYVVKESFRPTVCDFCFHSGLETLKKCTSCKHVYYCEKSCQINAWKSYHKQECSYLKKCTALLPDMFQMMGRIILKLSNGGQLEFVELPDGRKRYFKDLESHQEQLLKMPMQLLIVKEIEKALLPLLKGRIHKLHFILNIWRHFQLKISSCCTRELFTSGPLPVDFWLTSG